MFAYGAKTGSVKNKVFDRTFFKKFVVSRGNAFGRSSQRAKLFIRESAFLRARELFASEKVLESRLQVQTILKNYPVDDF